MVIKKKVFFLLSIVFIITAFQNCSELPESELSSMMADPDAHLIEDNIVVEEEEEALTGLGPEDVGAGEVVSRPNPKPKKERPPAELKPEKNRYYDYTTDALDNLKSRRKIYLGRLDRRTDAYWGMNDVLNIAYELYGIEGDMRVLVFLLETGEELVKRLSSAKKEKEFLSGKPVYAWIARKKTCKRGYAVQVASMLMIDNVAFAMYKLLDSSESKKKYEKRIKELTATYEKVFNHFKSSYRTKLKSYIFSPKESKLAFCRERYYKEQAGEVLPQNMNAAAGLAHYRMYQLQNKLKNNTAKAYHKLRFAQIASLVKSSLKGWKVGQRNGYHWIYWNHKSKSVVIRGEDSTHAILTMRFMVALNENGWSFSNTYIKKLGETFQILYNNGKSVRSHLGSLKTTGTKAYLRVLADMSFVARYDKSISSKIRYIMHSQSIKKYSYSEVSYLKYSLK